MNTTKHSIQATNCEPFHAVIYICAGVPHLVNSFSNQAIRLTSNSFEDATPEMTEYLQLARDPETYDMSTALNDISEYDEGTPEYAAFEANQARLRELEADPRIIAKKARLSELSAKVEMAGVACDMTPGRYGDDDDSEF